MTRSVGKFLFVLPAVAFFCFHATAWTQQQPAGVPDSPNHIRTPPTPAAQHKPKDIADEIRAKLAEIGAVSYSYRVPGGADSTHTLEQKLSAFIDCKGTYESTNTTVVAKSRTTTTTRVLNVDFGLLQPSWVTVSEEPAPVEAPAECFSGACGGHWTLNIATNSSGIQCNPRSSTIVKAGTLTAEQNFGCYDDANGTWVHEPLVVHQINVSVPDEDMAKHLQNAFHDLIAACGGKDVQGPH